MSPKTRNAAFKVIGIAHSPYKTPLEIPVEMNIRPRGFERVRGEIEIFPSFSEGLKDIDRFSHLIVVFVFHRSAAARLCAKPPGEKRSRGVFATRSPHRPNPIGLTVVRLESRKGNILQVSGIDMIEGTPVLDIKPYTGKDRRLRIQTGWMTSRRR